jgi:protein-disulfide isomerase
VGGAGDPTPVDHLSGPTQWGFTAPPSEPERQLQVSLHPVSLSQAREAFKVLATCRGRCGSLECKRLTAVALCRGGRRSLVLKSKLWFGLAVTVLAVLACSLVVRARAATRSASPDSALRQKIVSFLREKYAIPDNDPVAAGPLQSSQNPSYYECMVTVTEGAKNQSRPLSISKNGRYLALTPMFYLGQNANADIVNDTRTFYKLPPSWTITVGSLQTSPVPNFFQTAVAFDNNGKKGGATFYVTRDKRYAVLGSVYILRTPREVEHLISTDNQPYSGGANAPVTIVEYADLECPTCARLQPFLENELLPRYGDKVKLVYKDFPLPMHPWSRKAAIASQCAYQIDPSAYAPYRSAIFAHQDQINFANVRDQLLQLGEAAGIDRLKLAACLDSDASLSRIQADLREGQELQVDSTPTCFINGKIFVGLESPQNYYNAVDEALRSAR